MLLKMRFQCIKQQQPKKLSCLANYLIVQEFSSSNQPYGLCMSWLMDTTERVTAKQTAEQRGWRSFPLRLWFWNMCKFMAIFDVSSKICSERMELPVTLATKQGRRMACGILQLKASRCGHLVLCPPLTDKETVDERCQMAFLKTQGSLRQSWAWAMLPKLHVLSHHSLETCLCFIQFVYSLAYLRWNAFVFVLLILKLWKWYISYCKEIQNKLRV